MYMLRRIGLALCTLLLCFLIAPASRADEWNEKTIVTFNEAVEIPGEVLPAGTYIFQLADSESFRHMVQIWSTDQDQNQDQLLATIFAVPSIRVEATDQPVFEFEERPRKSPMALKYWFYPGAITGQEFAYD